MHRLLTCAVLGLVAWWLGGCSLFLEADGRECTGHEDCSSSHGLLRLCSDAKRCVDPAAVPWGCVEAGPPELIPGEIFLNLTVRDRSLVPPQPVVGLEVEGCRMADTNCDAGEVATTDEVGEITIRIANTGPYFFRLPGSPAGLANQILNVGPFPELLWGQAFVTTAPMAPLERFLDGAIGIGSPDPNLAHVEINMMGCPGFEDAPGVSVALLTERPFLGPFYIDEQGIIDQAADRTFPGGVVRFANLDLAIATERIRVAATDAASGRVLAETFFLARAGWTSVVQLDPIHHPPFL